MPIYKPYNDSPLSPLPCGINNEREWVLGFVFDLYTSNVILIKKTKGPPFMIGKLNALGGKLKQGEDIFKSIRREVEEECGLDIPEKDWLNFGILRVKEKPGDIHLFATCIVDLNYFLKAATKEEEEIGIYNVKHLDKSRIVPNLPWLLPMAVNAVNKIDHCKYFEIIEKGD